MGSSPAPRLAAAKPSKSRSCRPLAKRPCAMSLEAEFKTGGAGGLDRGRVRYFPVVPGRLEFALELRKLLLASRPAVVAVELPGFLADSFQSALARLPEL